MNEKASVAGIPTFTLSRATAGRITKITAMKTNATSAWCATRRLSMIGLPLSISAHSPDTGAFRAFTRYLYVIRNNDETPFIAYPSTA
jgi:hypothetical protein